MSLLRSAPSRDLLNPGAKPPRVPIANHRSPGLLDGQRLANRNPPILMPHHDDAPIDRDIAYFQAARPPQPRPAGLARALAGSRSTWPSIRRLPHP